MLDTLKTAKKAVGAKQAVKAVEKGLAVVVYLAEDAENRVTQPIRDICLKNAVTVEPVQSMAELGKICGIEVGAAAVAILK